ncbi:NmrA family NAD(P)-binding protein [Mycolicibacterium litorale]|uniref:NmrA family NAD(P)-binding protein n=1 Tax=Mycolicibacterium litorale TaxID=758802 RepID=UPI003CF329F5
MPIAASTPIGISVRIAVVGGTGNIGARLCREALAGGHHVRIMTRGGAAARELVALGAEPFVGSFDSGTPGAEEFFENADAAFTMVRSDWSVVDHYPVVAQRLATALRRHTPGLVVNLSAVGADLTNAGHSSGFGVLERALDAVLGARTVHLRAGWFMENFLAHVDGTARFGVLATMIRPEIALPAVAIEDVARAAAEELLGHSAALDGVREVQGPADLTMAEAADCIAGAIGRSVRLVHISPTDHVVGGAFLQRFGSAEHWAHQVASDAAFNEGRARFHRPRTDFDLGSLPFAEFVDEVWKPAYLSAVGRTDPEPATFQAWMDGYGSREVQRHRPPAARQDGAAPA